ADALFQAGKTLMAEGKYAEACPKFEESYKLEPALGALLNHANCLEQAGRIASAWTRWGDAVDLATRSNDDRKSFAEERRAALAPRLATLAIETTGDPTELEVLRDGVVAGPATFGVPIPVDPGEHTIEVAKGDDILHRETVTSKEGAAAKVSLDLAKIRAAAPIGRRAGPPVAKAPAAGAPAAPSGPEFWNGQRIGGFVVGSVGLAAGIAGFVFGGLALAKQGEADSPELCTSSHVCVTAGIDAIDAANTYGLVSTGLLAGGGALAALGVVLIVTAPSGESSELERRADDGVRIRVGLAPAPLAIGPTVGGSF
ncbi:MAG TPA: tetratricopeptide repeat protein, partial [Polyangiaceae bacterium]|nr:tetratricopeptide repeat protein [Polyangiaceae bacterium]